MALEYDLYLDGEVGDGFIKGEMEKLSAKDPAADAILPLTAYSFNITDYMKENIRENFGFSPVSGYTLLIDKFADADYSSETLIRFSLAAIHNEQVSNGILFFGGEIPILHYDKRTLFLNESRGYWDRKKIDLLTVPYLFKKIPVM